ncbi:FAD:protein FMN transferase [Leisingera caerulea]|uniref:FAD:protein FMN transferase n=1 Tax=Leisingera caerulea TaxID=506591 RepID=UPI0021A7086E|nr:FAD:protein FMN transferase [Leisingera caerulea]
MSAQLTRRRFLAISAAVLVGPSAPTARAAPVTWRGFALGAEARLTIHAPPQLASRAIAAALSQLRQAEQLFSLYDPASVLSRLNRAGVLQSPPPPFLDLARLCTRMHAATAGIFDPSVQPLWQAAARGEDISKAARLAGWHKVSVTAQEIRLAPGQALTFNGIGQGYATDMVRAALGRLGLKQVLVNAGEFAALGGPFRVGLADPKHGVFTARSLTGGAVATSSPGALRLRGAAHILHPTIDRRPQWATVSTEATSAALADAASTAFCLMNESEITAALARLPAGSKANLLAEDGSLKTLG